MFSPYRFWALLILGMEKYGMSRNFVWIYPSFRHYLGLEWNKFCEDLTPLLKNDKSLP